MSQQDRDFFAGIVATLVVLLLLASGYGIGVATAKLTQEHNLRCVNLQVEGPGHGTHGDRLLWVTAVCRDDDGLWRWSVPVEWSELQVSQQPPVEAP